MANAYSKKIATIFGGSGFIGRNIVRELADSGYTVKVATRVPEQAYFLKPLGNVGQIVPVQCTYDLDSVARVIEKSDVVINCIGILFEKKKSTFGRAHIDIPEMIAKSCTKFQIPSFIHISALGIEDSESKYAASKRDGEAAILKYYPGAKIIRPSIVFGPDDGFFNMFARMAQILPVLPLIGGGKTRFQPVYVDNVADSVMALIDSNDTKSSIYELGGPDVVTFKDIYNLLFKYTNRTRALLPLPWPVAKLQASILGLLPKPPLTVDQVKSLKTDSVTSGNYKGLEDLGVNATAMDIILPTYLEAYKPGGRFGDKTRHSA